MINEEVKALESTEQIPMELLLRLFPSIYADIPDTVLATLGLYAERLRQCYNYAGVQR